MPVHDFAVAAKAFDKPSETFIRRHARDLAPGRTALLAAHQKGPSGDLPPMPALWNYERRLRLDPGAWFGLRSAVTRFLQEQGTRTMLVEYGTVGEAMLPHALKAGVRTFVHFHGYDATKYLAIPGNIRRYQHMFHAGTGFFAPSHFIRDMLVAAGCPGDRITVAPCGVDPSDFPLSTRRPGRLLAVGRFVPKKAPVTTVRAFAIAARQAPALHLDYVGEGDLLKAAKAAARDEGIADHITFHGSLPHEKVRNLMAEAALFLQHSVTAPDGDCEGLPVAVMEAMAAGIPVVSTRHSGIPEAMIEGETGLLVDEHDTDGMARAILELTAAPETRLSEIARAARERIEAGFTSERALGILRAQMGLGAV